MSVIPLVITRPSFYELYEPYGSSDISSIPSTGPTPGVFRNRPGICHLDSSYVYVEVTETFWWSGSADSSSTVQRLESSAPEEKSASLMTTADQMALAVHTLGFNKRQLAELFGVSRQAIYDWLRGGNVSDSNATKLLELARLLVQITADTRRPLYHRFTTQPLSKGESSILDLLREDPWNTERILRQLRRARDLTTQRQAGQGTKRSRVSQAQGDKNLIYNLLSLGEG